MQVKADMSNALLSETLDAIAGQRPNATLRVLECKAAAGETANEALDLAMRVCGGAAFRKDVGVERYFRDARAAGIMAPTTDVLYDFIGKAVCGMPLF
jgi:alkylation response protein AidB-like acyl-CoA dehydrogenase